MRLLPIRRAQTGPRPVAEQAASTRPVAEQVASTRPVAEQAASKSISGALTPRTPSPATDAVPAARLPDGAPRPASDTDYGYGF